MTIIVMFHRFFSSLPRSKYSSIFSFSFLFILFAAGATILTKKQVRFLLDKIKSSLLAGICLYHKIQASGISLRLSVQQVTSGFQSSSEYYGRSQQCSILIG